MNIDEMMKTRSELLRRVEADLEQAKKLTKAPNFRLKEMEDLIEDGIKTST